VCLQLEPQRPPIQSPSDQLDHQLALQLSQTLNAQQPQQSSQQHRHSPQQSRRQRRPAPQRAAEVGNHNHRTRRNSQSSKKCNVMWCVFCLIYFTLVYVKRTCAFVYVLMRFFTLPYMGKCFLCCVYAYILFWIFLNFSNLTRRNCVIKILFILGYKAVRRSQMLTLIFVNKFSFLLFLIIS